MRKLSAVGARRRLQRAARSVPVCDSRVLGANCPIALRRTSREVSVRVVVRSAVVSHPRGYRSSRRSDSGQEF